MISRADITDSVIRNAMLDQIVAFIEAERAAITERLQAQKSMPATGLRATTATTGTEAHAVGGGSGYAASQFAQGERFSYALLADADGKPVEGGIGYLGSGLLVREAVLTTYASSTYTTPAAMPVSRPSACPAPRVICTPLKTADLLPRGAGAVERHAGADDIFTRSANFPPTTGSALGLSGLQLSRFPVLLECAWIDAVALHHEPRQGQVSTLAGGVLPTGEPGDLLIGWSNKTYTASAQCFLHPWRPPMVAAGRCGGATRLIPPGWYWVCINGSALISFSRIFSCISKAFADARHRRSKRPVYINRNQGTLAQPAPKGMSATPSADRVMSCPCRCSGSGGRYD